MTDPMHFLVFALPRRVPPYIVIEVSEVYKGAFTRLVPNLDVENTVADKFGIL